MPSLERIGLTRASKAPYRHPGKELVALNVSAHAWEPAFAKNGRRQEGELW
jgi:hypothetical protein